MIEKTSMNRNCVYVTYFPVCLLYIIGILENKMKMNTNISGYENIMDLFMYVHGCVRHCSLVATTGE